MPIGQGVFGDSTKTYDKQKRSDSVRVNLGLQKIREALINNAKTVSSQESGLPKDWRNRLFK